MKDRGVRGGDVDLIDTWSRGAVDRAASFHNARTRETTGRISMHNPLSAHTRSTVGDTSDEGFSISPYFVSVSAGAQGRHRYSANHCLPFPKATLHLKIELICRMTICALPNHFILYQYRIDTFALAPCRLKIPIEMDRRCLEEGNPEWKFLLRFPVSRKAQGGWSLSRIWKTCRRCTDLDGSRYRREIAWPEGGRRAISRDK